MALVGVIPAPQPAASGRFYAAPVQDLTELRALGPEVRVDKQTRRVEDKNSDYAWDAQDATADDGEFFIQPDDSPATGRWLKVVPSGGAPGAHSATHEDAGSDEINVASLSGELTDPQPPKTHSHSKGDLPAAVAYEDEGNDFVETQTFNKNLDMADQDATPVANRTWRVIDGLIRGTDTSSVEGRHISKASLEQITDAEVDAAAAIAESKLALNNPTHPEDHAARHAAATGADPLSTAAAGAITIGDAASAGTAETFARSDHKHSLAVPGLPADVTKDISFEGGADEPARADHKHDISTAVAAAVGTANGEGTATSLARSDHVHDHGAQSVGTHHVAAIAAGASGFMTGADKSKLDDLNSQVPNEISTTDATVTTIATIPIVDDSVNDIVARCVARRTDVDEAADYERKATVFRRAAGAATLLGSQDPVYTREDDNQWDFNIVVLGNNALLQVKGRAGRSIDWASFYEMRTIT